jgi:hypothetical protein
MGQFLSKQEICLKEYTNTTVLEKCDSFIVTSGGPLTTDKPERVVILGIRLLHTKNVTLETAKIQITGFSNRKPIYVVCPANYNGSIVDPNDQLLYRPLLNASILRKFVGMEEVIASASEIIHESNPIISFITDNYEELKVTPFEMQERDGGYYFLRREFLDRVKRFFRNAVFDNIHHDVLSELDVENVNDGVAFVLQIDYLKMDETVTEKRMKVIHRFI